MSLYAVEEAVAGPFCAIGVKMGSLLSVLDRAILQCEGQATAPLCHYTASDLRTELKKYDPLLEGDMQDGNMVLLHVL